MKAIVLAAGRGTRLRPVTDHVPKHLIPFFGKPFLLYSLEGLASVVDHLVLVVNYQGDMIRRAVGEEVAGVPVSYVEQDGIGGTGAALLAAEAHFNEPALVLLGDVFASRQIAARLAQLDAPYTLSLAQVDDPENHLGVSFDGDAATAAFTDSPWIDRGLYRLSPDIIEHLRRFDPGPNELRLVRVIESMMAADIPVNVWRDDEEWVQLGDHRGVAGIVEVMRSLAPLRGAEAESSSIDATVVDSVVRNSIVFGPGRLQNSRIEGSLLYVRGDAEGVDLQGRIDVVG